MIYHYFYYHYHCAGLNKDVVARILASLQAPRKPEANPAPYVDLGVETEFLNRGGDLWKYMASRR